MKNIASGMRDHEEAIEHAKSQRRHGEEVHGSDHFTVIAQECRPSLSRLRTRNPLPIQFEPCTMPENDRIWLHQDQRLPPSGPEATQRDPEKSVAIREPWLGTASREDTPLLSKARFSRSKSRRARKVRNDTVIKSFNKRSIATLYHRKHSHIDSDGVLANHND